MTAAERKARFDALVAIGCCVCRREHGAYTPPQVHHLRGGAYGTGMGQRADDRFTIPLCGIHHTDGGHGVAYHSGAKAFEANYGSQAELLAFVDAEIGRLK